MSQSGPELVPERIAVIVSRYNESVTGRLLEGARTALREGGWPADAVDSYWVPGAWELPLMARWVLDSGRCAGLVCLGAVIRGETSHDRHINRFVSLALGELAIASRIPVGFGLLTCDNLQQAVQRAGGSAGNKGEEAASAVLEMIRLRRESGLAANFCLSSTRHPLD